MQTTIRLFAAIVLLIATGAKAHDYEQGTIKIGNPWARPTPPGAKAGAAYLSLQNLGTEADTLVSVASPVSEKAQVHETTREGDIMKMREVRGGLALPSGDKVTFKPGGYHIMLLGLNKALIEGQRIPLILTFAKAGTVNVEAAVEKQPAPQPEAGMSGDGGMKHMH